MVIVVHSAECLPCGKQPGYSRRPPSSGLLPPTLRTKKERDKIFQTMYRFPSGSKNLLFFNQKRRGGVGWGGCPRTASLSVRLHQGISWQKAFWINLLIHCPVKRIWECAQWDQQLFLSTNVVSLQFNKVICTHSVRLCTHTSHLFKDFKRSF